MITIAHVFIVDDNTFDVHLKYNFAGTGAKDRVGTYLIDNTIEIKAQTEKTLTGLFADISRIRKGDKIIFYLQQTTGRDGMFFGSFEATNSVFLCCDGYLDEKLQKKLIFRIQIKPYKVYAKGITERECLDSLEGIKHPHEICWSLIYRKLKGNRGCTMITDVEYEYIMNKIKSKNDKSLDNKNLRFNNSTGQIECNTNYCLYEGKKQLVNIYERLKYKQQRKNAYETHLQAYLMQNLGQINKLKVIDGDITWIGNEMSCGVGMQSIDTIFIQEDDKTHIVICELKDEQPKEDIKNQIYKYIDWIIQFIVPTIKNNVVIHPTIVAPTAKEKTLKMLQKENICNYFDIFKGVEIEKTRYISFKIGNECLIFDKEKL